MQITSITVCAGEAIDTPNHLGFYIFVLQQLAYPASIVGLFATESGSDDAPVLVKQQVVQEATRAVFRLEGDALADDETGS